MGVILAFTLLRLFFSFKVTRHFGPFTKILTHSFLSIIVWGFMTCFFILLMNNYLYILLSGSGGCEGLFSCRFPLIEAMVGKVLFSEMEGNWAANLSFIVMAYLLGIVLLNMVVAKINTIYTEVVRRGTLFYYKDLFDLRYLYRLDSQYGFLASVEHPFSIFLLPTLCIVKCLERRRKQEEAREMLQDLMKQ